MNEPAGGSHEEIGARVDPGPATASVGAPREHGVPDVDRRQGASLETAGRVGVAPVPERSP